MVHYTFTFIASVDEYLTAICSVSRVLYLQERVEGTDLEGCLVLDLLSLCARFPQERRHFYFIIAIANCKAKEERRKILAPFGRLPDHDLRALNS